MNHKLRRVIYFILSKVYSDEGGLQSYAMGCPPVREIIHSLKLVDYLQYRKTNHDMTIT